MQNEIKAFFETIGILKYRLISHNIEIKDYDADMDVEICKKIQFNYLFFEFNSNIYRVDYSGSDKQEIKNLISEVIKNNFIFCDYINLDIDDLDYEYQYQKHKVISKKSLKYFKEKYQLCKEMKFSEFDWKMKVFTAKKCTEYYFEESTLYISVEPMQGMPIKEILIKNPTDFESIEKRLNDIIVNLKCVVNNQMLGIEQRTGMCIFSPEIAHMILKYLCNALKGEQILYGCSFISMDDFNKKIIDEKLSIYKLTKIMDSEGSLLGRKYYIKNGELISGINDIRTASYLKQHAGDTSLVVDSRCSIVNIEKVYISPIEQIVFDGIPVYDKFLGNQVLFNQLTGEIKFTIGTDDNSRFIHIEENIISLINKIQCSVYFDNEEKKYTEYEYGLLIDLKK